MSVIAAETIAYRPATDAAASPLASEIPVASFRERVAAQLLDWSVFSAGASGVVMLMERYHAGSTQLLKAGPIDTRSLQIAAASATLVVLLYFLLLEWVFGGSVGKLLCRLRVTTTSGERCGFVSALARNVLRPLDLVLGPIFMLLSPLSQRLGDRVGGTMVRQCVPAAPRQNLFHSRLATWEERARAAIVDLAIFSTAIASYLWVTGEVAYQARLHVRVQPLLLIPVVQLIATYFVAMEALLGGTVGKLVCGLRIQHSDRISAFAAAALRTALYPVDLASLGLIPLALLHFTRNRQHLGDLWATTTVRVKAEKG